MLDTSSRPSSVVRLVSAVALCTLFLTACERPFVDEETPQIQILEPNLSETIAHRAITISLTATSFREVFDVRLNGVPMQRQDSGIWQIDWVLSRGINELIFEAIDVADVTGIDTTYALHLPFGFTLNAPRLPAGRGGHTATFSRSADLFVVGGAEYVGGAARSDVYVLPFGATSFTTSQARLGEARTGHTTTRLPDGRLLILGGSRVDNLQSVYDLVESAEVLDPDMGTLLTVPVEGEPIRRTLHSAIVRSGNAGRVFVDLYGGRGDISYGSDPVLGVRRDLRTFEVLSNRVVALNDPFSAPLLPLGVFGHTSTQIHDGQHALFGTLFNGDLTEHVNFRLHYEADGSLTLLDVAAMTTPRTRHVATRLLGNLVALFGGRREAPGDVVVQPEIYSVKGDRFFRMPPGQQAIQRFGHTGSTYFPDTVLLVGGFGVDGTAFAASEFFAFITFERHGANNGNWSGTALDRYSDCDNYPSDYC